MEARAFHSPGLWPRRFWKRLAKCLAIAVTWGRARGAPCKTAPRSAIGEAMALPFVAGPQEEEREAESGRLVGLARRAAPRKWFFNGSQVYRVQTGGSPQMVLQWFGLWLMRSSFAVRALCAHQRQRNASQKAKRFQKRAGHGHGP